MLLDQGCWLDQHRGIEDLRPSSVKQHPEEPVCEEEPKPAFALTPEHGDLVPKGDKFKFQFQFQFQRGAATMAAGEQRSERGKNCDHAHNGMAVARKSLEPISKSFEEDDEAGELHEPKEVLRIKLPTDKNAALPLNPGEEPFD